jgi:hypothetical protein
MLASAPLRLGFTLHRVLSLLPVLALLAWAPLAGCGSSAAPGADAGPDADVDGGTDAGQDAALDGGQDAALDAGATDAGATDAGLDGGADEGVDPGTDAGADGSVDPDAGADAGLDGGPEDMGPPGPTAPTIGSVELTGGSACRAFTCTAVGVTDPQGDAVTLRYAWEVDGQAVAASGAELPVGAVMPGQTVGCVVDATDGSMDGGVLVYGSAVASNEVVAADEPPSASVVIPGHVRAGELLSCTVTASDDCNPTPAFSTAWFVDDVPAGTAPTLDTDTLPSGAVVRCSATVTDDQNDPRVVDSREETVRPSTWSLEALTPFGRAGYSLAVTDDLDGDGLGEIAIGAPDTSTTTAAQAGAVYVAHGRDLLPATDLEDLRMGTGGFVIAGNSGSYDVATMGCTPYLVSACPTIRNVGELDGEDTGPAGAGFGAGLAWLGDVNGDGLGELVASAPYELVGNLWRGRSYVISGAGLMHDPLAGGTLDVAGFTVFGECGRRRDLDQAMRMIPAPGRATNADIAGHRLVSVGDANGDGLGDFAVSAPNHGNDDEGSVFLIYGRAGDEPLDVGEIYNRGCGAVEVSNPGPRDGIDGIAAFGPNESNSASAPSRWGTHLANAGDFDGDGYDDLLAPSSGLSATNVAHILRGGARRRSLRLASPSPDASGMWGVLLGNFSFNGTTTTGRFGVGLPSGGGGDVNADGFDDLAFVARDFDRNTFMNVLFGRATDDDGTLRTDETVDNSGRGFAVPGSISFTTTSGRARIVGDLNGDGYDDIAASAVGKLTNRGRVYVIYGGPGLTPGVSATSLLAGVGGFVVAGTQDNENLGAELTSGDIDGDGLDDLVLGAPGFDSDAGWDAGRVLVVFGTDTHGAIDLRGSSEPDVLRGTVESQSLVGGRGDDLLVGLGGADVLSGGEGDDLMEVGDATFRRVRGGRGEDTLTLASSSGDLDLRTVRSRVEGVERFALSGQTLTVSRITALRVSDHSRVTVQGSGRLLTTAGDGWMSHGLLAVNGRTYRVLRSGDAELRVEVTLETAIPPTVSDAPWAVPENPGLGQVLGAVTAVDPDGDSSAMLFAMSADPSGALAIDSATGALSVTTPAWFDFEAQRGEWAVVVSVTDETGLETLTSIPMSVADVNEAPGFPEGALVWNVEEGTPGPFGNIGARDVDAGDTLTYSVATDPAGLFAIDPVTGEVTLAMGATLDFESAALHQLAFTATDAAGLSTQRAVTVHVGDIDVVERDLRLTFDLREWSTRDDDLAQTSAGLEIFGLTTSGQTEYCYTVPASDAIHTENFSTSWNGGWPSAPMSVEAEYSGTFCASTSVVYDEGSWNASVPVDVHLGIPDEVAPGSTFTLTSSATPVDEGAALWGTSPGLAFEFGMRLSNVNFYLAGCDNLVTDTCAVAFDRRNITTSFRDQWGTESFAWTAGKLDDPGRFVLTVAEPIEVDGHDIVIDWDDYWFSIARQLGLPSNTGSFQYQLGGNNSSSGMIATMDYAIFNTDVVFRSAASSVVALEVLGVDGMLTFEDGTMVPFRLGTPQQVTVPVGGDVDGDGDVDVSVTFFLDAEFTNEFAHAERAGYALSGGFGRTRVVSVAGDVLVNRRFGPALEQLCAPRVGGQEIPITCFTSGETTTHEYRPSGFNEPRILGGIDLATP